MSQKPKVTKFCRAIVLQGNKCNVRKMWSELHPEVVTMFTTAAEYCVATGEGNQEIARRILRLKMVLPELPFNIMGNILEYSHIDNCKNLLRSLTKEQSSVMDWGKLERDLYSPGYPKNEGERTLKAEVYKWRNRLVEPMEPMRASEPISSAFVRYLDRPELGEHAHRLSPWELMHLMNINILKFTDVPTKGEHIFKINKNPMICQNVSEDIRDKCVRYYNKCRWMDWLNKSIEMGFAADILNNWIADPVRVESANTDNPGPPVTLGRPKRITNGGPNMPSLAEASELADYRPLVLAAVKQNGSLIFLASERLKEDAEIIREAVKNDNTVIEMGMWSSELFYDENFIASIGMEAIPFASERIRNDSRNYMPIIEAAAASVPPIRLKLGPPIERGQPIITNHIYGYPEDTIDINWWYGIDTGVTYMSPYFSEWALTETSDEAPNGTPESRAALTAALESMRFYAYQNQVN